MKKYKKILIFFALLISLLFCVFISNKLKNKQNMCDNFTYDDILVDINIITNSNFEKVDELEMGSYMPIDLLDEGNFAFYVDKELNEYFAISKRVLDDKKNQLQDYVKIEKKRNKKIKLGENNLYTYVINSKKYESTIEGVIRSYIYCEKGA